MARQVLCCTSISEIRCKVKWKNNVMETDSVNADQEDEMGWNEVLRAWRSFLLDHRLGKEDARKRLPVKSYVE